MENEGILERWGPFGKIKGHILLVRFPQSLLRSVSTTMYHQQNEGHSHTVASNLSFIDLHTSNNNLPSLLSQ